MKYLSLYDLTGIQPYIFGSNVLKENLGGSFLVKQALDHWLKQAADTAGAHLEWSGGGNAMVTAPDLPKAQRTATLLSARLFQEAPGLYVACAHACWDESDAGFEKSRQTLHQQIHQYKAGRWPPAIFDGAGVTAACGSTGEPAVAWDRDDERWLGPAARARLDNWEKARDDLQALFELDQFTDAGGKAYSLAWTTEFDRLGRSRGAQSMLGIIHFDGNSMGDRFQNTHSLAELRDLSQAVNQAGERTLQAALQWVLDNLSGTTNIEQGGFELLQPTDKNRQIRCFPVRPIVYGGDDITLVCDARIALDLAAELLQAWRRQTQDLPGGPAHACTGIALVRVHYPFYRAYLMADKLCRQAKQYLRETHEDQANASVLDWEFIVGAGLATLDQRRKDSSFYQATGAGKERLHARPYYVIGDPPPTAPYRRWDWFRRILVDALQRQEATHTRFKELAGILYEGSTETEIHLGRWRDRFGLQRSEQAWDGRNLWLPEPGNQPLPSGFAGNETPYLDAIELMDRILQQSCYDRDRPSNTVTEATP